MADGMWEVTRGTTRKIKQDSGSARNLENVSERAIQLTPKKKARKRKTENKYQRSKLKLYNFIITLKKIYLSTT